MDTSETYVKMCEEAWSFIGHVGAYFILYGGDFTRNLYAYKHPSGRYVFICQRECSKGWFQVYSQDQIQDLFPVNHPVQLMASMRDWMHTPPNLSISAWSNYITQFLTFEQFWLTFYVHKIHGLTWTGEKWE